MIIGKVVGNIVSTIKTQSLSNQKLLVIHPLNCGENEIFVAVDKIGAGIGCKVLVTCGSQAQNCLDDKSAVDAVVIAIVESQNQGDTRQ